MKIYFYSFILIVMSICFTILPSHAMPGFGHIPPSDKLNLAGIGIGGMGRNNIALATKERLQWEPEKEVFTNSKAANELLHYEYRKPWKL